MKYQQLRLRQQLRSVNLDGIRNDLTVVVLRALNNFKFSVSKLKRIIIQPQQHTFQGDNRIVSFIIQERNHVKHHHVKKEEMVKVNERSLSSVREIMILVDSHLLTSQCGKLS